MDWSLPLSFVHWLPFKYDSYKLCLLLYYRLNLGIYLLEPCGRCWRRLNTHARSSCQIFPNRQSRSGLKMVKMWQWGNKMVPYKSRLWLLWNRRNRPCEYVEQNVQIYYHYWKIDWKQNLDKVPAPPDVNGLLALEDGSVSGPHDGSEEADDWWTFAFPCFHDESESWIWWSCQSVFV